MFMTNEQMTDELRALRIEVAKATKVERDFDTRLCLLDMAAELLSCEDELSKCSYIPPHTETAAENARRALKGDFTYRLEADNLRP